MRRRSSGWPQRASHRRISFHGRLQPFAVHHAAACPRDTGRCLPSEDARERIAPVATHTRKASRSPSSDRTPTQCRPTPKRPAKLLRNDSSTNCSNPLNIRSMLNELVFAQMFSAPMKARASCSAALLAGVNTDRLEIRAQQRNHRFAVHVEAAVIPVNLQLDAGSDSLQMERGTPFVDEALMTD